ARADHASRAHTAALWVSSRGGRGCAPLGEELWPLGIRQHHRPSPPVSVWPKSPTPHGHAAGSARMRVYLLWVPEQEARRSHRGHARYERSGSCLSVSSSPRMPSRARAPSSPGPWLTAAVPCSRNPAVSSSRSFRVPWTPIRSSHLNSGLTRRRSTRTPGSTPPGRRPRCWLLSVPMVSAPAKTTSTTGRGSPADTGPTGRSRLLRRLEGCGKWHVGEEACGAPLHDGLASVTRAVCGPAVP